MRPVNDFAPRERFGVLLDEDIRRDMLEALEETSVEPGAFDGVGLLVIQTTACPECGATIGTPCFPGSADHHFGRGAAYSRGVA